MRLVRCVLLFASLAASASAQPAPFALPGIGIAVPLGISLGGGDDAIVSTDLPFPVTFPDGTSVTSIDISTNGIIYPGGSGLIDPTESVAEFSSRIAIAPFWHDLKDFDGTSSQIYFRIGKSPTGAVVAAAITWLNVTSDSSPQPFTFQVVLGNGFGGAGSVQFRFDDRFTTAKVVGGLIGVSDGSGSAMAVDYSALADSTPINTPTSAFELFSPPEFIDFGRGDEFTSIGFWPNDPFDGYSLSGLVAPVPGVMPGRRACSCDDLGFTITPNGGGYSLTPGAAFDSDFASGSSFTLPRGSAPLPFTSPFPVPIGDRVISEWFISSGGSLFADSDGGVDGVPVTVTRPTIAPAAGDWQVFAAPNVWVREIDTHTFSVTWRGMRQWQFLPAASITDPPASTFQAIVSSNGVIRFAYEELNYRSTGPQSLFVGVADGDTPTMPDTDFSAGPATTSVPQIYELFLVGPIDFPRRINEGRTVQLTEPARIGSILRATAFDPFGPQSHDLFVIGLPASDLFPELSLGDVNPHLDSCRVLIDTFLSLPIVVAAAPHPDGTPIAGVPGIPELVGCELSLQALILNPASSPSVLPTDEVRFRIGM